MSERRTKFSNDTVSCVLNNIKGCIGTQHSDTAHKPSLTVCGLERHLVVALCRGRLCVAVAVQCRF